jgi:trehalose 6-phosphate phosphatase
VYESRLEADNRPLLERVLAVLARRPSGLVTDVDGTISPTVGRPEEAVVLPAARAALAALARQLDLVAVVSGRAASDARRMVGLPELTYVGNHGLETLAQDQLRVEPQAAVWAPVVGRTLDALRRQLTWPGVRFEDKDASASVHYREAADRGLAEEVVPRAVEAAARRAGLRFERGRMVVNLLPPLPITKGSAVRSLAQQHRLLGLVYLGDDLTDAHAFRALAEMRRAEGRATLSVAVVGPETPAAVRVYADATLASPAAVAALLEAVSERLAGR